MASPGPASGAKLFQGVEKTSAAFKLMMQMGWEEGTGLGKNKQGITTHVRVAKKHDTAGVGINEAKKAGADWTVNTAVYDTILKNLNVQASGLKEGNAAKPEVSSSSESDSDSDDSEVEDAEEKNLLPTTPVVIAKPAKLVRPQGRYKRREAGKEVNSYSSTDLSAILGHGTKESPPPLEGQGAPAKPVVNVKQPALKEIKVATPSLLGRELTANFPKLSPSWWGSKYGFVRAGELGSMPVPPSSQITAGKVDVKQSTDDNGTQGRTAFDEQDQENLYKLVQDNATSGRRGLGIGDAPRKVGGAKWTGAKVTFLEEPEEKNVPEGGNFPEPVEDKENGETISDMKSQDPSGMTDSLQEKKKKKRKADRESVEDPVEGKGNTELQKNTNDGEPSSNGIASAGQSEVVNEDVKVKKTKKSRKQAESTSDQDEAGDFGNKGTNLEDVDAEVDVKQGYKQEKKRKKSSEAEKQAEENTCNGKIEFEELREKKSKKRKGKQESGGQQVATQRSSRETESKMRLSDGKVESGIVESVEGAEAKEARGVQGHENGNSVSDGMEGTVTGKKLKKKGLTPEKVSKVVVEGKEEGKREGNCQKRTEDTASTKANIKDVVESHQEMTTKKETPSSSKLKWKKLIAEALTQGPVEGLKIKKLQKKVLTAASSSCGPNPPPEAELVAAFRKALEGGSSFLVEGKLVRYDRGRV